MTNAKNAIVAAIAKNNAPAKGKGKGTPAKGATATATPAKEINRLVLLDLPKGTERFTSATGKEWLRTPKVGDYQRWFGLYLPVEKSGIHKVEGTPEKGFTLTIERARVPYRELKEAIREIK